MAARKELAHEGLVRGKAAWHRFDSSPAVSGGRQLVERLACRRCHSIDNLGNQLATDLDRVVWKREQDELARSIDKAVENMPRFGLAQSQIETIIGYLLSSADQDSSEQTYRVHFDSAADEGSTFEDRCGGCHRALLARGPAGHGSAGPNLSGLLTPHYPRTARGDQRWTPVLLGEWLRNPRVARPRTTMRPVPLSEAEWIRLGEELTDGMIPCVTSQ